LKFFKTALKDDLRQWSSRHCHRRHRYRRRHRRSGSGVERKMKNVKDMVSHGQQERGWGVLPFVRRRSSFVVIFSVRRAMLMSLKKK
jgi:hypothetical protein